MGLGTAFGLTTTILPRGYSLFNRRRSYWKNLYFQRVRREKNARPEIKELFYPRICLIFKHRKGNGIILKGC